MRIYSLRKSRQILQTCYGWYKKKGDSLPVAERSQFETELRALDKAILDQDRPAADALARKLEAFCHTHFKKTLFTYTWEIIGALIFALVVATLVRQVWFELYEIPTGSMRPTFMEQDHLTVSKLSYGINTPLSTDHLYFDPKLVQRTSIVILSGEGVPIIDSKTLYFGVFPYTKRYVKRCIGKPGDTLYFYGGKIYGFDETGKEITELVESPWMQGLEHIPFLTFEGRVTNPSPATLLFNLMYQPIGKLKIAANGTLSGEVFNGKEWVRDQPNAQSKPHQEILTYSDVWGIRNYAMVRLLTKEQLPQELRSDVQALGEGVLYLELRHTPSLSYPSPKFLRGERGFAVLLNPYTTLIPLQQEQLDAILASMYTARFVVSDGHAAKYNIEGTKISSLSPAFPGVPDGSYEFYYGKLSRIGWGGITTLLPEDHPLYSRDPANIQRLFNLGIEMDVAFEPHQPQYYYPQRYGYFREGDLYLMGAPILKKNDPLLVAFHENEKKKEEASTALHPYVAFKDYGPPLKEDGSLDKAFIRTFGVKVPPYHYLLLGDNHAMSSDSRVFGFVPEANLQGAPSLIIWPPGNRLGPPMQKPYPILVLPRMIIWGIVALITALWYAIHRYKMKRSIFRDNR